jgi:hypothetical protein
MAIKINGSTVIADNQAFTSNSTVSASGTITGGNIATGGTVSATGNVIGNNILTGGAISATGNITAGNVIGNVVSTGPISTTGNVTGGNVLTGGIVSATGNVFGGNALFSGNLTVNGNVTYINSNVVTINDLAINLGNNAGNVSQVNNGGIELGPQGSPYVTFLYNSSANSMVSSVGLSAVGNITGGNLSVSTGTVTVGNIVNSNGNGVGNIGSSSTYFNTVFAKATSAQYADLAEKYTADADYAPGTVVMFGGAEEVTACTADGCRRVAGVISTNPSYIMNGTLEAAHVATVALTGRVPTKVTGTVRKGDLMVSAGNGRARAEADPKVGTVIGKALADHDGAEGVIEVVVGRF